jgi:hypothetical protein
MGATRGRIAIDVEQELSAHRQADRIFAALFVIVLLIATAFTVRALVVAGPTNPWLSP